MSIKTGSAVQQVASVAYRLIMLTQLVQNIWSSGTYPCFLPCYNYLAFFSFYPPSGGEAAYRCQVVSPSYCPVPPRLSGEITDFTTRKLTGPTSLSLLAFDKTASAG